MASVPSPGPYQRVGKRLLDLSVAVPLTLALLPLLAVVWLSLRPVLGASLVLTQERVGRRGQAFNLYKFRTMHHDRRGDDDAFDGEDRRQHHKSSNDPRHTAIGRLIRKFSLDELPQLLNICKGDMSLVGPRPELASVATPDFIAHPRHLVRPGLTGPYQVSPLRFAGRLDRGLPLDADYVSKVSLWRDVRYLLATVRVLVRGTGS